MVEVKVNKEFENNLRVALEEKIINSVKSIIVFTDNDTMISNVNKWYDSCGSELFYKRSNGDESYINTSLFSIYSRKFVYETLINYLNSNKELSKYFVAIPVGNSTYRTLVRSCSGELVLSDKIYRNIDTIKRHNSYVPGGITIEEVESSDICWCLPFMEKIDE